MKKQKLLQRIEALERRVRDLEARHVVPPPPISAPWLVRPSTAVSPWVAPPVTISGPTAMEAAKEAYLRENPPVNLRQTWVRQ